MVLKYTSHKILFSLIMPWVFFLLFKTAKGHLVSTNITGQNFLLQEDVR